MNMPTEDSTLPGPLAGIRVLNIGTSIVGPWAASLLAHLGADAIKVERPNGEFIRYLHPMQKALSTCYTASNNHQKSAELDIKLGDDLEAVQRLAIQADVLIENFRPGVTDRIGLGFEMLSRSNPHLVYASSSSWGDVGPMRDKAALDPHVQAFSGFLAIRATRPCRGITVCLISIHPILESAISAALTAYKAVSRKCCALSTWIRQAQPLWQVWHCWD